jgi:hypothetical protein
MRDPRINGWASDHDGERLKYRPAKAIVLSVDGWPTAAQALLIDLFNSSRAVFGAKEKMPAASAAGIVFFLTEPRISR